MHHNLAVKGTLMTNLRISIVFTVGCLCSGGCVGAKSTPNTGVVERPDLKEAAANTADGVEVYEEKWPSGELRLRVERKRDDEGNFIRHGRTTNYWENGRKKSELHFLDGVRHGPRTAWYDNGQIWSRGDYVDDKEDGTWTEWFPNGQKSRELHFDRGAWHGLSTEWHMNGQKWMEVEWVNGKRQGTQTIWDEQGNVAGRVEYVDGIEQP